MRESERESVREGRRRERVCGCRARVRECMGDEEYVQENDTYNRRLGSFTFCQRILRSMQKDVMKNARCDYPPHKFIRALTEKPA